MYRKWFAEASNDEVKDHIVNQIENTVAASSKEMNALRWQLSRLIQEIERRGTRIGKIRRTRS